MGNLVCPCSIRTKPAKKVESTIKVETAEPLEKKLKKFNVEQSTSSVTYRSFEPEATLIKEDLSQSSRFSWSRVQALYLEYPLNSDGRQFLTTSSLHAAEWLFNTLIKDITNSIKKMQDSFMDLDKNYPINFEIFASHSYYKPKGEVLNMTRRMTRHNAYMLYTQLKIITLLQKGGEAAFEVIKMIAVSHSLMKIMPSDFRFMDLAFGKFLIQNEYLHNENFHSIIYYLTSITKLIMDHINTPGSRQSILQSIISSNMSNIFRDNYRLMKRWRLIVESMPMDVIAEQLSSQSIIEEVVVEEKDSDDSDSDEPKKAEEPPEKTKEPPKKDEE